MKQKSQNVIQLIEKGRLDEVFIKLKEEDIWTHKSKEIILLNSSWSKAQKDLRLGLITDEEFRKINSRIILAILEILEDNKIQQEKPTKSKKGKIILTIVALILFLSILTIIYYYHGNKDKFEKSNSNPEISQMLSFTEDFVQLTNNYSLTFQQFSDEVKFLDSTSCELIYKEPSLENFSIVKRNYANLNKKYNPKLKIELENLRNSSKRIFNFNREIIDRIRKQEKEFVRIMSSRKELNPVQKTQLNKKNNNIDIHFEFKESLIKKAALLEVRFDSIYLKTNSNLYEVLTKLEKTTLSEISKKVTSCIEFQIIPKIEAELNAAKDGLKKLNKISKYIKAIEEEIQ